MRTSRHLDVEVDDAGGGNVLVWADVQLCARVHLMRL